MVITDMPTPESADTPQRADMFAALGADLLLLSIRPRDGKLMTARRIAYGLMGSELIALAAAGRIDVVGHAIVVRNPAGTDDAELDAALSSLVGVRRPPRAEAWVGLPRRWIQRTYLDRLASAGILRVESGALWRGPRYRVTAPDRLAEARSRIDAIAHAAGQPVDVAQAALAGLASAIGLGHVLYPGQRGQPQRARLGLIAATRTTLAARAADAGSTGATGAAAAPMAATWVATSAAVHAATSAAVNGAQSAGGYGPSPLGAGGHDGSHRRD
jgi:Golgi phosphoprotein 3 (GPP34)